MRRAGWAHVVRLEVIARVVERCDQQPVVKALVCDGRAHAVGHAEQVGLLALGRKGLRHDETHQHVGHLPIVRAQPLAPGVAGSLARDHAHHQWPRPIRRPRAGRGLILRARHYA